MPTDGKFGFSVLVGGKELPEYQHPEDERRTLVESVLWTPVTYWVDVREYSKFSEEIEHQKWPVTPYEIKIYTEPHCLQSWYEVYVDGVKVKTLVMDRGESKIIKGFPEGDRGYSEFLFSLPRFSINEKDRISKSRENKVGKIEVVRRAASFSHHEYVPANDESKECKFKQANKDDAERVTKKEFVMTTTRRGKFIREEKPYDRPKHKRTDPHGPKMVRTQIWDVEEQLGQVSVEYHMTITLQQWGVELKRPDWPVLDLGTVEVDD